MQGKVEKEGYTIIPIKMYFNKKGLKIEIGVAKVKNYMIKERIKNKKTGVYKNKDC